MKDGTSKGAASVEFYDEESLNRALTADQAPFHGRPINVVVDEKKTNKPQPPRSFPDRGNRDRHDGGPPPHREGASGERAPQRIGGGDIRRNTRVVSAQDQPRPQRQQQPPALKPVERKTPSLDVVMKLVADSSTDVAPQSPKKSSIFGDGAPQDIAAVQKKKLEERPTPTPEVPVSAAVAEVKDKEAANPAPAGGRSHGAPTDARRLPGDRPAGGGGRGARNSGSGGRGAPDRVVELYKDGEVVEDRPQQKLRQPFEKTGRGGPGGRGGGGRHGPRPPLTSADEAPIESTPSVAPAAVSAEAPAGTPPESALPVPVKGAAAGPPRERKEKQREPREAKKERPPKSAPKPPPPPTEAEIKEKEKKAREQVELEKFERAQKQGKGAGQQPKSFVQKSMFSAFSDDESDEEEN